MFRLLILALICMMASAAFAQSTAFTFQGKLTDSGGAATGSYDLQFDLFASGKAIGHIEKDGVSVTGGVFTVTLDFGIDPFTSGIADELEISVRKTPENPNSSPFTTLTPRQPLTRSPYSMASDSLSDKCVGCISDGHIYGISASKITGQVESAKTADSISGILDITHGGTGSSTQNFVDLSNNQSIEGNKRFRDNISFSGSVTVTGSNGIFVGNGSGLTNLPASSIVGTINSTQLTPDAQPLAGGLKLIGMRRWDLLKVQKDFAVGSGPQAIEFDGTNIWVANTGGNSVTKLQASDGTNLGTFPVGTAPSGLVFDGTNIWVTNRLSNNVMKLRASDGANLGTFSTVARPRSIIFDGSNIWVASTTVPGITKLNAADGSTIATFTVGNGQIIGLAFDGASVWVANTLDNTLLRLRPSDGAQVGPAIPVSLPPEGIVFDGTNIWVGSGSSTAPGSVTKIRASDGTVLGTFSMGITPMGLAFDGSNIWVADNNASIVYKLRASDGSSLGSFSAGANPYALAFDGVNIWVANQGGTTVTRLPPAVPEP